MRIRQINVTNYRQFRSLNLSLSQSGSSDLHVVIGENGTGKTNLLNAINWCLYGDEPHLSRGSEQLPIVNLKSLGAAADGRRVQAAVEVWACTDDGRDLVFERRAEFVVRKQPLLAATAKCAPSLLEARLVDQKGNTKIYEEEDAESCVRRFVPQDIREFFFFDGERLDAYFRQATAANIRKAVLSVSQIELLDAVERHLDGLIKDMRKSASRNHPSIEAARQNLEQAEGRLAEATNRIEELKRQLVVARTNMEEREEKLRGAPDVERLERERDERRRQLQRIEQLREGKNKEKNALLAQYAVLIPLYSAISKARDTITTKRQRREIPPRVDRVLLETILRQQRCHVCGRDLDVRSSKYVSTVLEEFRVSTDVAQQLLAMEGPLSSFEQRIARFPEAMSQITKEVDRYDDEARSAEERIAEIDRGISGHNVETIKKWHQERRTWEACLGQVQRALGTAEEQKVQAETKRKLFADALDRELRKEQAAAGVRGRLEFCERAMVVLRKAREAILEETRKNIEVETNARFLSLLWKKRTFSGVGIGDDYSISVTHAMGYPCLGSLGAAERELLALAFTLGLHTVSGFSAPILIDTPVARVAGENRVNFAKVLAEVAQRKQTILLFTPDEYSPDVRTLLDPLASTRTQLRMSRDEKETGAEVM
jgi:DNA sulfur modification protein DndD